MKGKAVLLALLVALALPVLAERRAVDAFLVSETDLWKAYIISVGSFEPGSEAKVILRIEFKEPYDYAAAALLTVSVPVSIGEKVEYIDVVMEVLYPDFYSGTVEVTANFTVPEFAACGEPPMVYVSIITDKMTVTSYVPLPYPICYATIQNALAAWRKLGGAEGLKELLAKVEYLTGENKRLKAEADALRVENERLASEKEQLLAKSSSLEAQLGEAEKQLGLANQRISALEAENANLKTVVALLSAAVAAAVAAAVLAVARSRRKKS